MAEEKLNQKERAYAEMAKRIDDTEALSNQASNELSEKREKNSRARKPNKVKRKGE